MDNHRKPHPVTRPYFIPPSTLIHHPSSRSASSFCPLIHLRNSRSSSFSYYSLFYYHPTESFQLSCHDSSFYCQAENIDHTSATHSNSLATTTTTKTNPFFNAPFSPRRPYCHQTGTDTAHLAIIMDGNGTWAEMNGKKRSDGHQQGFQNLLKILEYFVTQFSQNLFDAKKGDLHHHHHTLINQITVFALSTENIYGRPSHEINALIRILHDGILSRGIDLYRANVKVKFIGDIDNFESYGAHTPHTQVQPNLQSHHHYKPHYTSGHDRDTTFDAHVNVQDNLQPENHSVNAEASLLNPKDVVRLIHWLQNLTKSNTGLVINVAWNYGAQQEIANVAKIIAQKACRGEIDPNDITDIMFTEELHKQSTSCPVDILIRTGGEMRISNFMLHQAAYAELFFIDKYWPDVTVQDFKDVLVSYRHRTRKFGSIS